MPPSWPGEARRLPLASTRRPFLHFASLFEGITEGYTGLRAARDSIPPTLSEDGQQANGHQEGPASRRFRFDDLTSTGVHSPAISPSGASSAHSGRRLVLVAGATILLWGTLYVVFRAWRRAVPGPGRFGATQVVPVIDALAQVTPPGRGRACRRDAVRETHSMLVTVTGGHQPP